VSLGSQGAASLPEPDTIPELKKLLAAFSKNSKIQQERKYIKANIFFPRQ
jgi:hypothetical protein